MTAIVKGVGLPVPLLKRTMAYHYVEPMPAGLDDNRLKWREKPLAQPKKARPKVKAAAKPKQQPRPKKTVEAEERRYRKWSYDEKEDIARRYWHGEDWVLIAKDYGVTAESVRAVCNRWTGRK